MGSIYRNDLHGFDHIIGYEYRDNFACMQPDSLRYNRTGLLDRPGKAWSQDGGNMRVFALEVTC